MKPKEGENEEQTITHFGPLIFKKNVDLVIFQFSLHEF